MKRKKIILKLVFMAIDCLLIFLSIMASYYIYVSFDIGRGQRFDHPAFFAYSLLITAFCILVLEFMRLYNISGSFLYVREIKIIIKGLLVCFVLVNLMMVLRAMTIPLVSRFVMIMALVLAVISMTVFRFFYLFLSGRFINGYINVIAVGYNDDCQRFINTVLRHKVYGYRLLGIVDNEKRDGLTGSDGIRPGIAIEYLGDMSRLGELAENTDAFFVFPPLEEKERHFIDEIANKNNAQVYWYPENGINLFYNVDFFYIGENPFLKKLKTRLPFYYKPLKRLMDIILSLLIIIILMPFFIVLMILIKLSSRGPVFFRQKRTGKDGKPFFIYKFRTMKKEAPRYAKSPLDREDPRITGIGRFLRKFSFDEFPQLINVLEGKMSLVGPRPEMPFIVKRYSNFERLRLSVKPGLTGIWQISSERQRPIHYSIEYDIFYIYNRSLTLDSAILLETFLFLLNPRGI